MKKFAISLFAGMFALFAALAALAQERPADFRAHNAAIYSGPGGQPLTLPSQAAPAAVVMEFLRGKGYSADIVASLVPGRTARVQRSGLTHLRFHQQAAGLAVHDAYVKATVNSDGQLLHLIAALAGVGAGVQPAAIDSRAALDAALAELYPARAFTIGLAGRSGNMATFAAGDFFYRDPTVTRVAVAMEGGGLREGFLVETWSEAGNLLHHTLIGPGGEVLKVQLRTNNDSYNIFPDHPGNSVQTVTDGPGAGNAQSQAGWLSGNQSTIDIAGNNAHAYLDTLGNNQPDKGGSAVGDGNFLAQADPTQQPYTVENQAVAVQNLFFFNNVIHDKLYRHGFDEAAGNFQDDNFGLGGNGNDSVKAEAQDGSGINNANFATPPDGSSPRMQMFLWTGNSDHMVVLPDSTAFPAAGAEFGPSLYNNPLGSEVVAAIDGIGTATDGCEPLTNDADMAGRIALIDRGSCRFDAKVKNAQLAGAIGVIIANNQGDDVLLMGGNSVVDGVTITIPSVFIGQSHGAALRAALPQYATLIYSGALYRDGDVDSDIIYHEYGHGLTWRMIGDMSGPMSGAIGEGMSDVLAILINNNDVVAEYSNSSSIGIRSAAYTGYPRGYGDFTGGSVHFDGEIYAATIWRLWQLFQAEGIPQDTLFDYLIGGMEFTPSGPAFENMRDGILQAVSAAGGGHECLVWEAFAQFGVGTGAQYTDGVVTPSADMPPACDGTQPALDLAIASISVDTTPVFDAVANNVSVRVSNVGSGPADAFSVTLTDNGLAVGTLPVAGLASGASADLDFAWTPSGVGDHLLVASHDLADATGSNDSAMLTVAVQFRHNVAVLWVGAPATVDQGAVVAVSVGVENKGADSESFNVTLIDETAGGAVIGQQPVTGLASGTTRTLAFDWDTAGASLEGHVLTATADAVPGETYLDDNSASASSNVVAPVTGPSIDSVLPTAMDASESPLDVVILGSGFGTDPNGVTVTFVDSKGSPPVATVNAVTDSRIDITVTVKDKGKKGYFIWDMVVATSNGSAIYSPFIVTR